MTRQPGKEPETDQDWAEFYGEADELASTLQRRAWAGDLQAGVAWERAVDAGAPCVLQVRSRRNTLLGDVRATGDCGLVVMVDDTLTRSDLDFYELIDLRLRHGRERTAGWSRVAFRVSEDHELAGWCKQLGRRIEFNTAEIRRAIANRKPKLIADR
jgi:hypothetical protein